MECACKIIYFGDSITREYVPIFENIIKSKYPKNKISTLNAGVIGETSRDGLNRIEPLLNERPEVIVIGFGMNDWRKGVGKEEFRNNISNMVDRFDEIGTRVILLTISPYYKGIFEGTEKDVDEYSFIIRNIAAEKRIKIADVNSLWKRRIKPVQKGLRDNIHPNKKGYEVICEALLNVVPQSHTTILWQYNGHECRCNYKCPYCYYAYSDKSKEYFWGNIEDWRNAFKGAFGNQKLYFYLGFGEPMLGKRFYDVVKMIEEEPKWNLRIITNLSLDLSRLMDSLLVKEKRLFINASFHPTQVSIDKFIKQLQVLRDNKIEAPVVYVMWPPHLKRFISDYEEFNKYKYLVHIRRFKGQYRGKTYPRDYTDEERQFIAKYCDDATIKYMLNEKYVDNRFTYSGLHFYVVDCTGNIGYDSDCFKFHTKYRTIFGNIIQDYSLKLPMEPTQYPEGYKEGTADGVANYLETGYDQLEDNHVISFAEQGGVYKTETGVVYKNLKTDFNDSEVRAEYNFPSRGLKDRYYKILKIEIINYLMKKLNHVIKIIKDVKKRVKSRLNRLGIRV